jgi:hypothetical protein
MIDDVVTQQVGVCPTCSAPLAADQRYCVYCGTRAPQARFESLDTLRAEAALPSSAPAAVVERNGIPLLAVVAALGVGALLGHWATPSEKAAPAPATQVIRVTGEAPAAATAAPSATAPPAATGTPTPTATAGKSKGKDKPTEDLSKDSIKKAVKDKAPISTGGTPPPKDNKPAGGGSDFETIG